MEIYTLLIVAATVFGSSLLQAATGIGYGVIAGPVFLLFLDAVEAIQISTLHNLLIAVVLFPFLRTSIHRKMLWPVIFGSAFGIVAGFYLQTLLGSTQLKLIAACMVLFVITTLLIDLGKWQQSPDQLPAGKSSRASIGFPVKTAGAGLVAGLMGGMLAMPGPVAAAWMSMNGMVKNEIRATVLAFFVMAYGSTLLLYLFTVGLGGNALRVSALFAPVVLAGVYTGNRVAKRVSDILFKKILILVLMATLVSLLVSILL